MKRPVSVTIASVVFILAGLLGIAYHFSELAEIDRDPDVVLVFVVRAVAIAGGVFAMRGATWARWLLLAWIVYHVYLSFFHEPVELIMHTIIAIGVAFAFFHPKANAFFRERG